MKAEKSLSFACSSPSGQTEELTHMYHFIKLHRPEIDYSASANEAVRGKDRGEGEEGKEELCTLDFGVVLVLIL